MRRESENEKTQNLAERITPGLFHVFEEALMHKLSASFSLWRIVGLSNRPIYLPNERTNRIEHGPNHGIIHAHFFVHLHGFIAAQIRQKLFVDLPAVAL